MKHLMQLLILAFLLMFTFETRTYDWKNMTESNKRIIALAACVTVVFYFNYKRQNQIICRLEDINNRLATPLHLNTVCEQVKNSEEAILTDIEGVGEGLNTLGEDLPKIVRAVLVDVLKKEKIKVIEGYPFPTPEFPPTLPTVTPQPGKQPITITTTKPK